MKNQEDINERLIDNKMILRIKENAIKDYYERINKSSSRDKENEQDFNIRYKRLKGEKLSRKRNMKTKSRTKKKL